MSKMRKLRSRRVRRQANMVFRTSGKFEVRHRSKAGRTGKASVGRGKK